MVVVVMVLMEVVGVGGVSGESRGFVYGVSGDGAGDSDCGNGGFVMQ